jgi:MFS family permease
VQGTIATALDAFDSVSWFTSTYLIALTSLIPVAGRLCIIFTPRYYLFASVLVIAIGLLVTSQAGSLTIFLVGRALTGIGAAAITPVALILVADLTSTRRRGLFFGLINVCYTTGVSFGAVLAGALEPALGWRAVFWLQIPLVLVGGLLALATLPKPSEGRQRPDQDNESFSHKLSRIDYLGILTLISAVTLLLYGLSASRIHVAPIVFAVAGFMLFVFVEAKWAIDPIVPTGVMKSKGMLFTGLSTLGLMTARWAVLFYTPVYAIAVRGWVPAIAGLMLIPTNAGFGLGGVLAGWLHIKKSGSFYTSCLVCFVLFAASNVVISQITTPNSNIYVFVTVLFCNGFVTGSLLNYSLAHVLHLTHPSSHAIVLPLIAMFRGLSGSFGSAISGGMFIRTLQAALRHGFKHENVKGKADLVRRLLGNPRLVYQLSSIEHDVAVEGYVSALRMLFIFGAVLSLAMLVFQALTGWTPPDTKDLSADERHAAGLSPVVSREAIPG